MGSSHQSLLRRAGRSWWLAAVPLLATLAALWLGWLYGGDQSLDVGTPADEPYVAGFYDREESGGASYRWSQSDPSVQLPAVRAPSLLVVRMAGRPEGVGVALRVGARALPPFDVKPLEIRRYRVLLGPTAHAEDLARIVFGAQAERTPADARRLAVLVESVTAQPLVGAPDAPPLPTLLALAAVALAAWALLRLSGAGPFAATALSTALGVALAAAWYSSRLFVGPYLPAAGVAAVAGAGLLGGLRAGVRGERVDAAQLVGCLAAAAGLVPLTLILAGQAAPEGGTLAQALLVPLGIGLVFGRGRGAVALGALIIAAAGVAAALTLAPLLPEADVGTPFHALHRAASRLWFGTMPLYNTVALAANPFANTFSGPPALAALALPTVALPYAQALLAWRLAGIALLLAAGLLLLRAYDRRLRSWPAAGLGLLLLTLGPLFAALGEGRAAPLFVLLAAAGLLALRRGRDAALGACLGCAAALSPVALVLLGFPLVQRRWRALAGALLGFALVTAAALLVAGWPAHAVYGAQVAPALPLSTPWPQNQSLHAFLHRLLAPEQLALRPASGGTAQLVGWALAAALLALTAWLSRRGALPADRGYALWLVLLLVAAPVTWAPEHALLLVPLFIAQRRSAATPWPAAACLALGVALLAHGDPLALYDGVPRGVFWQLALSTQLYGALLVYMAAMLAARPAVVAASAPYETRGHEGTKARRSEVTKLS